MKHNPPTPILSAEEVLNAAKRRTPTRMQLADSHEALRDAVAVLTEERDGSAFLKDCAEAALRRAETKVAVLEAGLRALLDCVDAEYGPGPGGPLWLMENDALDRARALLGGTE